MRRPEKRARGATRNDSVQEEPGMLTVRKQVVGIYVDRSSRQWVVRDADGNFWVVPATDNPWDDRLPFEPTEETELEPVPGHYKQMVGLPT